VASLVLDDELPFVDLFLVDRVRVNTELLGDHLPGGNRRDRASAVHPDHNDIVEVDLLALGKFVHRHHVAALDGHRDLHILGPVKILLDELGHEQRTAMEGSCGLVDLFWIGDEYRDRIIDVLPSGDTEHSVHHLLLEGKLEQGGDGTAALRLLCDLSVRGPRVIHISFL